MASHIFLPIQYCGKNLHFTLFQDPETEDMCQRLRVAIKVGTLDGQDFYQSGDGREHTFVGIKVTRKNGAEFALFGNVRMVRKP